MSTDTDLPIYIPGISEVGDIDLDKVVIHHAGTGERVTEADVEREAIELEKSRPWLKPGGKSLSGDGSHSPVLRLVVSTQTKNRITQAAQEEGVSVSKWLRRVVEERLAA